MRTTEPELLSQRDAMHDAVNRAQGMINTLQIENRRLKVLVAWQATTISEGQACKLLGLDRLAARELLQRVLADVAPSWSEYREHSDGRSA